jgi:hypothetical protein
MWNNQYANSYRGYNVAQSQSYQLPVSYARPQYNPQPAIFNNNNFFGGLQPQMLMQLLFSMLSGARSNYQAPSNYGQQQYPSMPCLPESPYQPYPQDYYPQPPAYCPPKDGYNGKDGKDGLNGCDGKDGKDGINGKDGKDGINGKDGYNGKDGKNGYDGKNGKDGINGKDGKDGVNGKDGKDGVCHCVHCEPPVVTKKATLANLNWSGDPKVQLNSLTVEDGTSLTVPTILKNGIDFSPTVGSLNTILTDASDKLKFSALHHDINDINGVNAAGGVAMKTAAFEIDGRLVEVTENAGDTKITVYKGLVADANAIAKTMLKSEGAQEIDVAGTKVGFSQQVDGPNGEKALRAVVATDEYEFNFGNRKPDGTLAYLDMNARELKVSAADDAVSGFKTDVASLGTDSKVGLAEILNLGQGANEKSALYAKMLTV